MNSQIKIGAFDVDRATESVDAEHVIQFYDDDAELISQIACAICVALDQGCAVACIATDAHRQLLEDQLANRGDAYVPRIDEQIVFLDAAETLASITDDDLTDAIRFNEVIGALVDRLASRFPRIWIFGELVALMSANGNRFGAVKLERLFKSITESRPLSLYCVYPASALSSARDLTDFLRACEHRYRVVHSRSSLALSLREPERMWHES